MEVYWNDKMGGGFQRNRASVLRWFNAMSMRLCQGHARYGLPKTEKLYIKRIRLELKAYRETGNCEHLYNIANYCWLESEAPSNPKFHLDTSVDSVTRGRV